MDSLFSKSSPNYEIDIYQRNIICKRHKIICQLQKCICENCFELDELNSITGKTGFMNQDWFSDSGWRGNQNETLFLSVCI